jgi:hypothetical protein
MSLTNSEKIIKAILNINPNAKVIVGNTLDKITWLEDTAPIPREDIEREYNKINNASSEEHYTTKRLGEYPHWQECIHALLDGGETLENLQALRKSIKEKYPKN